MNSSALLRRDRPAILLDCPMSSSLTLTTFLSLANIRLRNSNFDGTKLPIVVGHHRITTDGMILPFFDKSTRPNWSSDVGAIVLSEIDRLEK
jgi:hypothetical protein